jgi:hypothetical protein
MENIRTLLLVENFKINNKEEIWEVAFVRNFKPILLPKNMVCDKMNMFIIMSIPCKSSLNTRCIHYTFKFVFNRWL